MMDPPPPYSQVCSGTGNESLNAALLDYLSETSVNPHFVRLQIEENQGDHGQNQNVLSSVPNTSWLGTGRQYKLKYCWNHFRCCPRMRIRSDNSFAGVPGSEIEVRSGSVGCWLPCFLRSGEQRIRIGVSSNDNFVEKLSFNYAPNVWCCGSDDGYDEGVDFFSPDLAERFGWLQLGSGVTCGSKIGLNSGNVIFTTRQNDSTQMGVTFSNIFGQNVAAAAVTRWQIYKGNTTWKEFSLILPPPETLLSDSERTLIFAVFVLWVLNAEENFRRHGCRKSLITIAVVLLFVGIFIWITSSI